MELTVKEIQSQIVDIPMRPPAMMDSAIAGFYGVETREINQAVSRNPKKFPSDFCFQLTMEEVEFIRKNRSQIVIKYAGEKVRPRAFTREGCNMLATILGSDIAIDRCIQIIRVFSSMEAESLRHRYGSSKSGEQITGERFDLSVKRFKVALEAVKLMGMKDRAEVRRIANEITRDTTGVDLMAFILPYCSPVSGQGIEEDKDEAIESFVSEWWERHAGNPVTSRQLYQMIADNKIPLNLGTGSKRSQKVRLSRMLTKMSGRQVGACRIVGAGKCKGVLSWKLEKVGK